MKPTVGRIVHYQAYGTPGGEYPCIERAAVVTQVDIPNEDPMTVGLAILNPTGMFFNPAIKFSEEPKPGCWSWMPFQKAQQQESITKPDTKGQY